MKNMIIKKEKLKEKLGEIVPFNYVAKNKNEYVFVAYLYGSIPIKIKSKMTHEEFCKIC